jgi:hypothetical protein
MQSDPGSAIVSNLVLAAGQVSEGRFTSVARQVHVKGRVEEKNIMPQPKTKELAKPPALSSVKQLKFQPNLSIKKALIEVGIEVQKELSLQKHPSQPVDRVLRVIVR